jgi:hypothetical protein
LSAGHSDITRFRHGRQSLQEIILIAPNEKIPKVAQTTGTLDIFDPHSGISGPTFRELPHVQIFMNDGPILLT